MDWAECMKFIVDELYPQALKLTIVMDNLNTHSPASLYVRFDPVIAKRIADKLDIQYTPKHGSWLNMAEIEFSALSRQCLNRRIPSQEKLVHEVEVWERMRNEETIGCNWQFTTSDARIKLKRLYPTVCQKLFLKLLLSCTRIFLFVSSLLTIGTAQALEEENVFTTRLFYIRHGEVPGNDPDPSTYIYTGCGTDDSLTEKGRAQAMKCAREISDLQRDGMIGKVSAIYSSDLKRAAETAQVIANELGLDVHLRHNLREIDWGCADGQLVQKMTEQWGEIEKQIKQRYPERKIRWDYLPVFAGAETYNALLKRSVDELKSIAEMHQGELALVVGHGRVLKTLIADAKDTEEQIPYPSNCGIADFTYSPDVGLRFVKVFEEQK